MDTSFGVPPLNPRQTLPGKGRGTAHLLPLLPGYPLPTPKLRIPGPGLWGMAGPPVGVKDVPGG